MLSFLAVQVEHPVTAEFNLPAALLGVAMGIPLWRMPGTSTCHSASQSEGNGSQQVIFRA
jgi:hypothetical protein